MNWQRHRITAVSVLRPYVLHLTFADGLNREVDLEQVLAGEMYGPLRNERLFSQVSVDAEVGTVQWPNGADFDPSVLHDWDRFAPEFVERANAWAAAREARV